MNWVMFSVMIQFGTLNLQIIDPYLGRQMSKRDDTSTGTATRAARCGSLLEGLGFPYAQARWTQGFLSGSGRWSVKPNIH
jgi:hypothetical protein